MTTLQSESIALDHALNGITNTTQLKDKEILEFAIQLFSDESDIGDQTSMLIESDNFEQLPSLLISFATPQNPHPTNDIRSDTINSMIKDSVRDKIADILIKCLVDTYTFKMNQLLEYNNNDLHEINQDQHNDQLYAQCMET